MEIFVRSSLVTMVLGSVLRRLRSQHRPCASATSLHSRLTRRQLQRITHRGTPRCRAARWTTTR